MHETLPDFLEECEFANTSLAGDDLFAILESLEGAGDFPPVKKAMSLNGTTTFSKESINDQDEICTRKRKRQKLKGEEEIEEDEEEEKGHTKISHITVERNRRKQMNEHLSVLRSLMPCFYVKRGDQASVIGGVVEYITELQQVLQSLEAKKQRKAYAEVLSPRLIIPSPRRPSPTLLSPRKPPLSPRLHISPRTPQPSSPYGTRAPPPLRPLHHHHQYHHGGLVEPPPPPPYSPSSSSSPSCSVNSSNNYHHHHHESSVINELVANTKSSIAEVEVKFSGANVLLKTVSHRIPGQALKIIAALEDLALEILQFNINTVEETMLSSFTIKIGIECQLSAEELAQQVQQTFC